MVRPLNLGHLPKQKMSPVNAIGIVLSQRAGRAVLHSADCVRSKVTLQGGQESRLRPWPRSSASTGKSISHGTSIRSHQERPSFTRSEPNGFPWVAWLDHQTRLERTCQPDTDLRLVIVKRPRHRCPAVIELDIDPVVVQPQLRAVVMRNCGLGQPLEVPGMARPDVRFLTALDEPLQRVLADRLQHDEARLIAHSSCWVDQARGHQGTDAVEDLRLLTANLPGQPPA